MTEILVNQKNYSLGCRICRRTIVATTSCVELDEIIAEFLEGEKVSYSEALELCTGVTAEDASELPKRLCSDCASRLSIAYQLRRDTLESDKILRSFVELEASEMALYEAEPEEVEYVEYETLYEDEDDDENDDTVKTEDDDEMAGSGDDAVAFLTGILKPNKQEPKPQKVVQQVKQEQKEFKPPKKQYNYDPDKDGERRHACNVCSKKFQKRSNLIDHLRLHANVKVYSCEFCERSFVQSGNYKAHLRVHTKEKPYSCNMCGKAYSQSSSLKIHMRSHTQEKNYICTNCNKGFTNASDLAKHKLIHDPNKKFHCEICKRGFTQKVHFRKHCEKHHPELVFEEVDDSTTFIIAEEEEEMA